MSATILTGILLIALPIIFNVAFAMLARLFDYPDILRRSTGEVLQRFQQGGTQLVMWWWVFAMTAVAIAPLAVLLSWELSGASGTVLTVAAVVGVLAATVQFLGLVRWPFLVPYLARVVTDPEASPAKKEAVDVVFQTINRYLGVAVGEHLGYLLTGSWTVLVGVAITQSPSVPTWIGIVGIVAGVVLALCSLEFVGPFERDGWHIAGMVTPIAYIVWSGWLVATGIALLL
ncbi:MAG: DUF4386 domain-containing protein [Actinobacteria bacterium]|nr:DUF4386 domain-containing protein [Actinomycetota bacterium]